MLPAIALVGSIPLSGADQPRPWSSVIAEVTASAAVQREVEEAVVFAGSSSFARWADLGRSFPELPIVNRGIGGLQLSELVQRFDGLVGAAADPAPRRV